MTESREPSSPPSDPIGALGRSRRALLQATDRPVRVQLVAALLVGLILVVTGLYLWHRPVQGDAATPAPEGSAVAASAWQDAGARAEVIDAAPPLATVSDVRVVGCHDRGPKITPPESCDRLPPIEQALSRAVEQSVGCVPPADPGGTIEYVADVSFSRHRLRIRLPRAGRSVVDRKAVSSCAAAVRDAMHAVALDSVDHQHARYDLAITATYRGGS